MSKQYNLIVMACVGLLHTWHKELTPYTVGQTLGQWCKAQSFDVGKRLFDQVMSDYDYELSHMQVGCAIDLYLTPLTTPGAQRARA